MHRNKRVAGKLTVCGLLAFSLAHCSGQARPPIVESSLGPVQGTYDDADGVSYLGVPYGDSVSGAYRWTAPRPAPGWKPHVLDATVQPTGCPDPQSVNTTNEDCLKVNIYTPGNNWTGAQSSQLLPVVVWIHGGGFFKASIAKPLWQGEFLVASSVASGNPVIMVSVDYRLGALGFLASPTMNVSGNFGILDQQLALQWVQDNIAAFGGDPARVTIHGQSAGAMSAHLHLVSPLSKNLFHRVHMRSNVGVHYRNYSEAEKHASVLADSLLCFGPHRLECLRSKPMKDVVSAELAPEDIVHLIEPGFGLNYLQWLPVIDHGDVLPDHPLALVQAGKVNPGIEAVVIGTVMNESLAFAPWSVFGDLKGLAAEAFLDLFLDVQFGSKLSPELRKLYSGTSPSTFTQATATLTDYLFTCYSSQVAEALATTCNVPTYVYTFRHVPTAHADPDNSNLCRPAQWNAACHAGDNMFAFGTQSICANASFATPFEAALSNAFLTVDVNLTAANAATLQTGLGAFGAKYDPRAPRQLIFGSPDGSRASLFHIENSTPGLQCDYLARNVGWQ